jgi:hypothetical protein
MVSINEQNLYRSLRGLRAATASRPPLTGLQVVTEVVNVPDFPDSEQGREYALNQVLSQIITAKFSHQRMVLDHALPAQNETRAEAEQAIHRDSQTGNLELLGWSWLYYHFVRVDLQIGVAEFCEFAGICPRTLRRYQRRTIKRLTAQLIEAEQTARQKQRSERHPLRYMPTLPNFPLP